MRSSKKRTYQRWGITNAVIEHTLEWNVYCLSVYSPIKKKKKKKKENQKSMII